MTPQQLKNSILQWAVQGKLVPQNPSEEPAKILLEKIKAEKAELIKQKKIKADKNSSTIFRGQDGLFYETAGNTTTCIQDEIPFDIPDSWEWVRLGEIGQYRKGPFGSSITKNIFVPKSETTIKVYEQKNAIYKDWTIGNYYITNDYYQSKMKSFTVVPQDIIVSCAGTIGETYILPENAEPGIINQALMRIKLYNSIYKDFFLIYFDYMLKKGAKIVSKGSAIKNIPPFEKFKIMLFPLPPLAEQKRIVKKIERLMPFMTEYAEADTALLSLEKSFPENLKKSLLQWAVQGKLVPQNPNDEPAKILLEKIKVEKAEHAQKNGQKSAEKKPAEKKSCGQKKTGTDSSSSIFRGQDGLFYETVGKTTACIQDEIPFDIPGSWAWVRLGEIADIYTGNSINEQEKKKNFTGINTGRPYIATKDVLFNNTIVYNNGVIIPHSYTNFRIAPQNSALMCIEGGSAGRKIGITNQDVCFGNKLCCFFCDKIEMNFLFFFLQSPDFTSIFFDNVLGIIGGVSVNKLKKMLFPLPPLAEQKRIAEKLKNLLPLCTGLENKEK